MNNLKNILSSQPKKQKQIGLLIMILGLAGLMTSMSYLGLFGATIEYSGNVLWKEVIAFSFLILGLYGAGYAFGGKQIGFSFAKWWAIFLIGASVLGHLIRGLK